LGSPATSNRAYNLSGGTVVDYNGLVGLVGRLLQRQPWLVHLPVGLSTLAVRLSALVRGAPRLSVEQVLRLNEHKDFDHAEAVRDFGFAPMALSTLLENEIAAYRRA
jgi:hypothetical protein